MKSEKLDWGLRSSKFPTEWRTWAQFLMLLRHQHKLSRVSQGQDIVSMTPTPTTGVFTWRKHGRFLPTCFYESKNIIEIWSVSAYPNVDFLLTIATIWDHNHWPCILVACIQYVWRVKSGKLSFICITINASCQYQYFLLDIISLFYRYNCPGAHTVHSRTKGLLPGAWDWSQISTKISRVSPFLEPFLMLMSP